MDRRQFVLAAAGVPLSLALEPLALAARLGGTPVAFVTADLESHVVVLDLDTAKVTRLIRTGPGPRSIESVHDRIAVVAHTKHAIVTLLDAASSRIRAEIDRFEAPRYTAVHPRLPFAYITDSASEEVVVLDAERGRVLSRTRVPGPARHVSVSPNGKVLWTSLGSKAERLAVLDLRDPRRPRLEGTIVPPFVAHDVVFAPRGRYVWVTSGAGHRVALYRADTREIVRILDADRAPQHVAFVGDLVLVSSGDDGRVRVHRLNGDLIRAAEVPVGSYNVTFGGGIAVTPSLSRGTVTVLDERGRVQAVRKIARAAHDACVLSAF